MELSHQRENVQGPHRPHQFFGVVTEEGTVYARPIKGVEGSPGPGGRGALAPRWLPLYAAV